MVKRVKSSRSNSSTYKIDKVLIENFVALQKVMTNLSKKFDELSKQISKLLQLFEISAKSFAKKDFTLESADTKELSQKMDNLLQQNKTVARGLTLMYEANRGVPTTPQPPQAIQPATPQSQQPLQPSQPPQVTQSTALLPQTIQPVQPATSQAQTMPKTPPSADAEKYQKSISSANEQEQGYQQNE